MLVSMCSFFPYLLDKTSTHQALSSELKIALTPIVNLSPIQFPSVSHPGINTTTHHSPLLTLQPASKGSQGACGSMAGVPLGRWPFVKRRSTRRRSVLTVSGLILPPGPLAPNDRPINSRLPSALTNQIDMSR